MNEEKTCRCRLPEESITFLGYRIGRCYSPKNGSAYIGTVPEKKKVKRLFREISEQTSAKHVTKDAGTMVEKLNAKLRGWANYFCLGPVRKAYRAIDEHTRTRLRQWLARKHEVHGLALYRWSDDYLHGQLGLIKLTDMPRQFP